MIAPILFVLFSYGLGLAIPLLNGIFLIPIFMLMRHEKRYLALSFIFLTALWNDQLESLFPLNTFLAFFLFLLFMNQKIIPYMQGRLMLFLGFLSYWSLFMILKTILKLQIWGGLFSWSIVFNFLLVILCYMLFEIGNLTYLARKETKLNVRR